MQCRMVRSFVSEGQHPELSAHGRIVARFTCDKGKQRGGSSSTIITGGGMKIKMLCCLHLVKFRDYVVVDTGSHRWTLLCD